MASPIKPTWAGASRPIAATSTGSRRATPIAPLLDQLELTAGKKNWGYQLRFGLVAISDHDMASIAAAMGVKRLPR